MSLDDLKREVIGLDQPEFDRFLIRLGQNLTIAGRESYRPEPIYDEPSFDRLRTINELFHTITNKQLRDSREDGLEFPRETFWAILAEVAGPRGANILTWVVAKALGHRPST